LWALVIGSISFAVAIYLVYRVGRCRAPFWLAVLGALAFGVSGVFAWHSMSGMETLLATTWTLGLLYGFATGRVGWIAGASTMLALTRPEGAVGAFLASLWLGWDAWRTRQETGGLRRAAFALLPVCAVALQPLLNAVLTGSFSATGSQAKSLLSAVAEPTVIMQQIVDNVVRVFREWLFPPLSGRYGVAVIPLLALAGIASLIPRVGRAKGDRTSIRIAGAIAVWLAGAALLISTLDTAFWHFKRYQIPLMALFFPIAAWGAAYLPRLAGAPLKRTVEGIMVALLLVSVASGFTGSASWLEAYALNTGYVSAQPLAIARWLAANTPPDAYVAVHDVGLIRFEGARTTLDMVGLTTPGAAAWWRQGPGAVGEWLVRQRPDYIAAYGEGHGLGLGYLQATDLYRDALVTYSIDLDDAENVALAAETQGVYQPDWRSADDAALPRQESLRTYREYVGMALVDMVNVADLDDERAHDYTWRNQAQSPGFPTEFWQFDALDCLQGCIVAEGGRRINGEESFVIDAEPGRALLLLSRVHAAHTGELEIYANDTLAAVRVLPYLPGQWVEFATYIPPELVTERTRIRITPRIEGSGDYMPFRHWAFQSRFPIEFAICADPAQVSYQDGRFTLNRVDLVQVGQRLDVMLNLMNGQPGEAQAQGDYLAFVHLYADINAPPAAQIDRRPANGTLPPGNWLPGMLIDTYMLDLTGLPPARYRAAVGFYNPYTFERLQPRLMPGALEQFEVGTDGRLWVGDFVYDGARGEG
jgi:hypothetical protein